MSPKKSKNRALIIFRNDDADGGPRNQVVPVHGDNGDSVYFINTRPYLARITWTGTNPLNKLDSGATIKPKACVQCTITADPTDADYPPDGKYKFTVSFVDKSNNLIDAEPAIPKTRGKASPKTKRTGSTRGDFDDPQIIIGG